MRQPNADKVTEWMTALHPAVTELADIPISDLELSKLLTAVFDIAMHGKKPCMEQISAAVSSLDHLRGKKHDYSMLARNVMRIVANWNFIAEGVAVPEWDGEPVTTEMLVIGVYRLPATQGADRIQYAVKVKLKTGLCAGIIYCTVFNDAFIGYFLDHKAGVASYKCSIEELAGMQATAVVSLTGGRLKVASLSCNERQKKHNRRISELRSSPTKCEYMGQPCNVCRKTVHECKLAVWLKNKGANNG